MRLPPRALRSPSSRAEPMVSSDDSYETPKWRTIMLLIGFAALVGIGVVTVLQPELEDEPEDTVQTEIERGEAETTDSELQE